MFIKQQIVVLGAHLHLVALLQRVVGRLVLGLQDHSGPENPEFRQQVFVTGSLLFSFGLHFVSLHFGEVLHQALELEELQVLFVLVLLHGGAV